LYGTVPLTTGTFEFSVTAFAPGPREITKAFALCPDGTSVETEVLVQDPPAQGTKKYVINIIGIDTASPLSNAVPEQEYTQYFAATGFGATPLWGLAGGDFPDWLTFNTYQGVIYGTPPIEDDGATYTFAIFVQDGERQCVKSFQVQVAECFSTASPLASGNESAPYSQSITPNGTPQPGYQFSFSITSGSLPSGLSLNGTTGEISGTPTESGDFVFTVQLLQIPI
jgi:hypothetical protein